MKITADTNVLIRAVTGDDPDQSATARAMLDVAETVALTLPALCEFVWVLASRYRHSSSDIAETIRRLIGGANVSVDRPAVEAGLAMMDSGGDFADGVIAHEGEWLGAEVFVSFDRRAIRRLEAQGRAAMMADEAKGRA